MPKKPELSAADQALRESIGSAIRVASATRSRKPADVAVAGGVSLAHQYRIESGERTADALYLVKVARFLNVTVDELIRPAAQNLMQPPPAAATKGNNNQIANAPDAVQIKGSGNTVGSRSKK